MIILTRWGDCPTSFYSGFQSFVQKCILCPRRKVMTEPEEETTGTAERESQDSVSTHHLLPHLPDKCWSRGKYPIWPISPPKSGPATSQSSLTVPIPQPPRRHHYAARVPEATILSRGNTASRLQSRQDQVFALTSLLSDTWPQMLLVKEGKQPGHSG